MTDKEFIKIFKFQGLTRGEVKHLKEYYNEHHNKFFAFLKQDINVFSLPCADARTKQIANNILFQTGNGQPVVPRDKKGEDD